MTSRLIICFLVLFLPNNPASAWPPPATRPFAHRAEFWSCVMPDQEVELRYRDLREDRSGRVSWKLTKDHRTLAQGPAQRGDNDELKIKFVLPDIEVHAPLELKLKLTSGDRFISEPLYLYPADPFKDQQKFLEQANLYLFDPTGETSEIFESASIPCQRLESLDSVEAITEGLLVIGQGLAIEENEGLFAILTSLLEKDVSVILLAPDGDSSKSPRISFALGPQQQIFLQRQSITKQFDKRFDTDFWSAENSVSQSWQLSQDANNLTLKNAELTDGWCWIEIAHANCKSGQRKQAALVVCGLGIIDRWADGPMPKHLLLKMFETYSKGNESIESRER